MLEGKLIEDFPDYLVNEQGQIFNVNTERELSVARTRNGVAKITVYRDGVRYTRSVALIVAKAFVWNDFDPDRFDTPIHLNHEPLDNRADNLQWRPRWFALKYARQYWYEIYRTHKVPVRDALSGERFSAIRYACEKHGVLWFDVHESLDKGTRVFPYGHRFERI